MAIAYAKYAEGRLTEALVVLDNILQKNTIVTEVWKLKGDIYFDLKDYSISFRCYQYEMGLDASKSYLLTNKGKYLMNMNPQEAIRWFDEDISVDVTNTLSWYYKAHSLFLLKRYYESSNVIDIGLSLNPGRNITHLFVMLRGYILNATGRYSEAIECFNFVIDSLRETQLSDILNVLNDVYKGLIISHMNLRKFEKALQYCDSVPNTNSISTPYEFVHILKGYCNLESNNVIEALDNFETAIQKNGLDIGAKYGKGLSYAVLGKSEKYREQFNAIINSNQNIGIDKMYYVASAYSNLDMDNVAIDKFKIIIKNYPDDLRALSGLATSLLKVGKTKESHEYVKKVLTVDNEDLFALTLEGSILVELDDVEKAEKLFNYVLSKDETYMNAILQKSILLNRKKNYEEAIKLINGILEKYPNYIMARIIYSMINYSQGRVDEAIEYLKKTIELDPHKINSWYHLGEAYSRKQNWTNAIRCYSRAIELNSEFAEALNARAIAHTAHNNTNAAKSDIKKALQLNPSSYKYHENFVRISSLVRNSASDFLGYWGLNKKRKVMASLLILSVFFIYFATPALIIHTTETTVSNNNGESITRTIENARISDVFILVILALILIILFSPLLRKAKVGINQIELDFLEERRILMATPQFPDSYILPSGRMS